MITDLAACRSFPLQRAFKRINGFSWAPIWRVRGSVFQDSLQMVAREVNSLRQCANLVAADDDKGLYLRRGYKKADDDWHALEQAYEDAGIVSRNWMEDLWRQSGEFIRAVLKSGRSVPKQWTRPAWMQWVKELRPIWQHFVLIREVWSERSSAQVIVMSKFRRLQLRLARNCGRALYFLEFKWRREEMASQESLMTGNVLYPQLDTSAAEEFVCLVYSNFVLMVLMRMRTLVMSMAGMFVLLLLSISSYPFEPKQALRSLLVVLSVIIGSFVAFVYAQMHRDATLSRITDTKPGELGL